MKSNVSLLSEISLYTHTEGPLADVLQCYCNSPKEDEGPAISHKEDNTKLMKYFSIGADYMKKEYILQIKKY
jgi:hypothetical protein